MFGFEFKAVTGGGFTRQIASLDGIEFVLIPNEIAEVDAKENRHQLTFYVDDVDGAFEAALDAGGTKECDAPGVHGSLKIAVLRDPDGNTLELNQQL